MDYVKLRDLITNQSGDLWSTYNDTYIANLLNTTMVSQSVSRFVQKRTLQYLFGFSRAVAIMAWLKNEAENNATYGALLSAIYDALNEVGDDKGLDISLSEATSLMTLFVSLGGIEQTEADELLALGTTQISLASANGFGTILPGYVTKARGLV